MKTIADKLAGALRACLPHMTIYAEDADIREPACNADKAARDALAAYDAQRAAAPAAGLFVVYPDASAAKAGHAILCDGRTVAQFVSTEDAARIAACVNACHGMTLAEVESFGSPGELGRCAQLWASDDGEEVTP